MHTERWGTGPRRALLIHGVTSSAATMWELGEGLAASGWSAVAVDLPGHGESGPASSYRFADVAASVASEVGAGWDLVLAHSLGGAVAVQLLEPSFATRALFVDPALVVSDDVADGLAPELEQDQIAQTEASVAAANPHWHPRTVAERVRSTQATSVEAVRGYASDNRPWDVREQARAVTVPVHVLVPTDGPVVSSALVDELSGKFWTFETVADTGHSVHRDRPELVVERAVQ
ncbi:alpha/beta fold hydrolase [Cryptosporangium phraense]|uniref:Alpha/beta hydrolase n=1 Tax=Cryptosporangium phraense TaxID=2593070 RepID=A0A545AJ84_9ACTN|nr:alpha/beta hydrolase [Cryptosporangium phraense]TQS41378.1 alpha/beta hydrolase [Cryptosporangium phraense]